jgi:hypothetical protein
MRLSNIVPSPLYLQSFWLRKKIIHGDSMWIIGLTIKNKFSIPLTNELLNELNGSNYFSKLDLRLGYYQVRIYAEDIEKTTFRIHHRYLSSR